MNEFLVFVQPTVVLRPNCQTEHRDDNHNLNLTLMHTQCDVLCGGVWSLDGITQSAAQQRDLYHER